MADATVKKRLLGRTGIEVSRLGLAGSFGISADDVERAFLELGITYFFVTPRMKGLMEGLRRLIRAGHRDRLVLASGANFPTGGSVEREWKKIATKLGVDQIDIFHLFWVQGHWYVSGKTWPAMERLKEEGRVRALAISCHKRTLALELAKELPLDVVMLRYNAAHRGAEREVFAHLEENRPGVVAYTATRWGKLLKPLGAHKAMSGPECYRFSLGHPAVDTALSGARNFEELAENVRGVAAGSLSPERLEEVKRFGDAVRAKAKIGWGGRG